MQANKHSAFAHLDQSSVNDVVYAAEQYKMVADDLATSVIASSRSKTLDDYAEEYAETYGHEYPLLSHDEIVEIYVAAAQ